MRRQTPYVASAVAILVPAAAWAWTDVDRMKFSNALGTVLAAEEVCDLDYDQSSIRALVEETVPPDDMQFAPDLQMMTWSASRQLEGMSDSAMTAHCAAIGRTARHDGFIE